jgi:GcrA cell cycle regulator
MIWDEISVDKLKTLNDEGLYTSEIAAELGTTRNAVIGKLQRLGIATANRPHVVKAAAQRKPRPRARMLVFRPILATKPLPAEPTPPETALHCTILELHPRSCRWPVEEIAPRQFLFCGNDTGETYCEFHNRLAYNFTAG